MAAALIILTRGSFYSPSKALESCLVHVLSQIGVLMFVLFVGFNMHFGFENSKHCFIHRAMGPLKLAGNRGAVPIYLCSEIEIFDQ